MLTAQYLRYNSHQSLEHKLGIIRTLQHHLLRAQSPPSRILQDPEG